MRDHKWALIWRFIFVCSMIIEHDLIPELSVMVSSYTVFADIITVNLRLYCCKMSHNAWI